MIGITVFHRIAAAAISALAFAPCARGQSGHVYTLSGAPIAGAKLTSRASGKSTYADAQGFYDFAHPTGIGPGREGAGYALVAARGGLRLRLDRPARVAAAAYDPAGRVLGVLPESRLPAGETGLPVRAGHPQIILVYLTVDGRGSWLRAPAGFPGWPAPAAAPSALTKPAAAPDTVIAAAPGYGGGLAGLHRRAVPASGGLDFRLVSADSAWDACAPVPAFTFDTSAGAKRYRQIFPDWASTEREALREACQAVFRAPSQAKHYDSYKATVKDFGPVGWVATTGGNQLNVSSRYVAQQPANATGWYEMAGVQVHEAVHSFQPYYNAPGDTGFGESMADAVRALAGFFRWGPGVKCEGDYTAPYQVGGKYWYYIELKRPGFLSAVWRDTSGTVAERVKRITGQPLDSLAKACRTQGMP